MKQKLLEMVQFTVLFHTDEFIIVLVYQKRNRAPKPHLGCQNWVTSTGGCQNLVTGRHSQRRGPVWSGTCPLKIQVFMDALQLNCNKFIDGLKWWRKLKLKVKTTHGPIYYKVLLMIKLLSPNGDFYTYIQFSYGKLGDEVFLVYWALRLITSLTKPQAHFIFRRQHNFIYQTLRKYFITHWGISIFLSDISARKSRISLTLYKISI